MAQYSIKHTCGHQETVQIYGTSVHGEREKRAAWLESKPCRECENAAVTRQAQQVAQAQALPVLTGSEKQIAWAERVRVTLLANVEAFFTEARQKAEQVGQLEALAHEMEDQYQPLIDRVRAQTSASWWIDHRDASAQSLLLAVK